MDEFDLIAQYFTRAPRGPDVVLGVGDDGAVVRPTAAHDRVYTVDMLVEGRHFLAGTDAERLGHKALAVSLSDLAAMGAHPRQALVALALPEAEPLWLAAFTRGLFALADAHEVDVIGGDTTRGPRNICLTLMGDVPAGMAITRAGALPGDEIWVSGTLGDAMLALAALQNEVVVGAAELALLRTRLEAPTPRVALGEALRGIATAAIDISDGLTGDLGHLLKRSGVGADVTMDALPRSAALDMQLNGSAAARGRQYLLAGGDDYELCFTAPAAAHADVIAAGDATGTRVTHIGRITNAAGLRVQDAAGAAMDLPRAFRHFG